MTMLPIGPCPRCGQMRRLMPSYHGWFWQCACPPLLRTYTSSSTVPMIGTVGERATDD